MVNTNVAKPSLEVVAVYVLESAVTFTLAPEIAFPEESVNNN